MLVVISFVSADYTQNKLEIALSHTPVIPLRERDTAQQLCSQHCCALGIVT